MKEKENYAQFLAKEVNFQDQLLAALRSLQIVQQFLNEAEDLASRTNLVDALHKLEGEFPFDIRRIWLLIFYSCVGGYGHGSNGKEHESITIVGYEVL